MPKFYEIPADYMQSLPWVFQGIKEMEELAKIINPYLDGLNAAVKRHTDNANVLYANEEGIARWEKILGVSPPHWRQLAGKAQRKSGKAAIPGRHQHGRHAGCGGNLFGRTGGN